jgi:hypothetical protein
MNVPGDLNNHQRWALMDFRDAVYYPVVSFLGGGNPYDSDVFLAVFPVTRPFPPYSPSTLLVHLPFGLIPHTTSQLLYFGLTIVLTLVLAHMALRMCERRPTMTSVFGLATLILVTRPGHWNLMLGQTTLELVLAVYIALYFGAKSTRASGFALAVATIKPTFGVPLFVLMLVQRYFRPVGLGIVLAVVATLIPVAVLVHAAGGGPEFAGSLEKSFLTLGGKGSSSPVASPYRVDMFAFVSRLWGASPGPVVEIGIFIFVMAAAGATILRVRKYARGNAADLYCISVASLAILISSYQLTYSILLLILPLIALLLGCWAPRDFKVTPVVRYLLILLLSIPLFNFLEVQMILRHVEVGSGMWLLLTSVNSVALLLAFSVYVSLAFRAPSVATFVVEEASKADLGSDRSAD